MYSVILFGLELFFLAFGSFWVMSHDAILALIRFYLGCDSVFGATG